MGANGLSYNDTVFQSIGQGVNFTNYNNGWTYRNDGVDIETWTGTPTIGSIDTNEWLHYTVQVPQAGLYEVSLQYAAPTTGSKVKLLSNENTLIPEVTLNASGGWGSWQWSTLGTIPISAQSNFKIKLKVIQNGLNIKALRFDFAGSLIAQNFLNDNPMIALSNSILTITSKTQIKEVTIYDVLGKLIKTESGFKSQSVFNIPFDYSKGMYFIRIEDGNHSFWNLKIIY
jgi:hypothetical protein